MVALILQQQQPVDLTAGVWEAIIIQCLRVTAAAAAAALQILE
jgi:hypothetical protein